MRRRVGVVAAVGVAVAVLLGAIVLTAVSGSGDGSGEPDGASASSGRVSLDVGLKRFRAREADRVLLVVLHNPGSRPVSVDRARLDSPDLDRVASVPVNAVVAPGQRVDVPVPYGASRCESPGGARGQGATVRLVVRAGGESVARHLRLALPSPEPLVAGIVDLDCQRTALDAAADVRLGPELTRTGRVQWRGEVVVRRRESSDAVSLLSVDGSVVYNLVPEPAPPARAAGVLLRLDPGQDKAVLPLTIRLPSCAPHLLTEAKKALVFPMHAQVGDGPDLVTTLTVEGPAKAKLLAVLAQICGR